MRNSIIIIIIRKLFILCGTHLLDINVSELALLPSSHSTTTVVNRLDDGKLYRPQLGPLGEANLSPHGGSDRD